MERVPIEGFAAEVQVGSYEFFRLAQEEIPAGFEVEMQSLQRRQTLRAREVRQHVHAEDAVEAADVAGPGQVHAVKSNEAAQARLHKKMRSASLRPRYTSRWTLGLDIGIIRRAHE